MGDYPVSPPKNGHLILISCPGTGLGGYGTCVVDLTNIWRRAGVVAQEISQVSIDRLVFPFPSQQRPSRKVSCALGIELFDTFFLSFSFAEGLYARQTKIMAFSRSTTRT